MSVSSSVELPVVEGMTRILRYSIDREDPYIGILKTKLNIKPQNEISDPEIVRRVFTVIKQAIEASENGVLVNNFEPMSMFVFYKSDSAETMFWYGRDTMGILLPPYRSKEHHILFPNRG